MSEVLRRRRLELGLSQAALAAAAGVDMRQIRRYEAGAQQPLLSVAVALAEALDISVGELAGVPAYGVDLGGHWRAAWQGHRKGTEAVVTQPVQLRQERNRIEVEALDHTSDGDATSLWRGELRLWDNEILMGWYAAVDGAVRSKGTLYLVLHSDGQQMSGRWVGRGQDAMLATGRAAMAKTDDEARQLVGRLNGLSGNPDASSHQR